jgi:hypothetical protein
MSSILKSAAKGGSTKTKEQSTKKKKKILIKQTPVSESYVPSSSLSNSSTAHQQHHSAPPLQSQQSKSGLHSINENVEYLPSNGANEQQQQQQSTINTRFPRSSTVPYPAYATLRQSGGNRLPSHYYYTDYPTFIHGTVSPAQANIYFDTRQPLSSINTNFQPISPHHQQYSNRPVDILKPTFLIVPKEAEQQLAAQLSTSNSPVPPTTTTTKSSSLSKPMTKKPDTKTQEKSTAITEQSSSTLRTVEVQTNNNSPSRTTTEAVTTVDNTNQHVGLIATPNPSPYVHFVNVSYSTQSPPFFQDGPPETSIMQDEYININDYHQPSASIRSMPNIALAQGMKKNKNHFYILIFNHNKCFDSNSMHIKTPPIDLLLSFIGLSSSDIAS